MSGMERVVVVGGGYGGVALAQELDEVADVVLVEPKDAFVHAVATLRAVVDPAWQERVFLPYDRLLTRGRVVHDWARLVSPHLVRLSATEAIEADHVVLATGTAYPFPAKFLENQVMVATAHLARLREALGRCERVMLVGAGPVGLELAGELTSAFPGLGVTLVDQADDILTTGDYLPELRTEVRTQLEERGVELALGAPLGFLPLLDIGRYGDFAVETTAGVRVEGQMWFRCYGARPITDFLDEHLSAGLRHDGSIQVTAHLNVAGQDRLWAIGDITDVRESKRAAAARDHAAVVAQNIRDAIEGRPPSATYTPSPELIVLPLGPDGGASQLMQADGSRVVVGAEQTRQLKGADLLSDATAAQLGLAVTA